MKKIVRFTSIAVVLMAAISCSSASKMAKLANDVTVTSDPEVLTVVADKINTNLNFSFPNGYFNPKAILLVTPVIVYDGSESAGKPLGYQGEKVLDNYKVVAKAGQNITEKLSWSYVDGMEDSELILRGVVKYKDKTWNLPARKVADGANVTSRLVNSYGVVPLKADDYQEYLKQTEEGQILYKVNSSTVNSKELKSSSVKDFQAALDEIAANDRKKLTGTEVVAYASPEGGEKYNAKLSDARSQSGEKAFDEITKGKEVGETEVKSVGQDWEGFQELVAKSDIKDKDLILRVLNMYSDPAVRESEIKNISQVYTSLKTQVLPELRRARFIANVEYKNYTPEELLQMVDENADVLDEEALLRAATLVDDNSKKESLYQKAIDKYGSERASFNLASTYLSEGKADAAKKLLSELDPYDADVKNALGVAAMQNGDYETAAGYFKRSGSDAAKYNKGIMDILQGDYEAADKDMSGQKGNDAALAHLLNNNLNEAEDALDDCNCPKSNYLRAIIAARKGDSEAVKTYLNKLPAGSKLASRAEKDVEFAKFK